MGTCTLGTSAVNAVQEQHLKIDIQIQRTTETLIQSNRTGVSNLLGVHEEGWHTLLTLDVKLVDRVSADGERPPQGRSGMLEYDDDDGDEKAEYCKQAGELATVLVGFGYHCIRKHRQDGARGEGLNEC